MRESPPAHYRAYWRLQDNEKKLTDLAKDILMGYIQSWSQTNRERCEKFAAGAKWVGFQVEVETEGENAGFKVPSDQEPLFDEMRQKIRNIGRGNFESEVVQIANILQEYKRKAPRWFWQKWPKPEPVVEQQGFRMLK